MHERNVVRAAAAVLEYRLASSAVRQDLSARPIVFRSLGSEAGAFSFVPARAGPLVRDGAVGGAAATVTTHPEALVRLLLEPGFDPAAAGFPFVIEGDVRALEPLARALLS